jgi:hypothetical protein
MPTYAVNMALGVPESDIIMLGPRQIKPRNQPRKRMTNLLVGCSPTILLLLLPSPFSALLVLGLVAETTDDDNDGDDNKVMGDDKGRCLMKNRFVSGAKKVGRLPGKGAVTYRCFCTNTTRKNEEADDHDFIVMVKF